jgi:Glycosyltransferase family 9 (heptosyltransferase)
VEALVQCKAAVRRVIPHPLYERGSILYRKSLNWTRGLVFGFPDLMLYFGTAAGDDLLCTVVLRELKKRSAQKIWIISNHSELFVRNADVAKVVPEYDFFRYYPAFWGGKYQRLEYARYDSQEDRSVPTTGHVITELCARAGVTGEIALHPYFYLSSAEKESALWANGMIAIQSSGLASKHRMQNKEWYPERFQEVVHRLKNDFKFVQIGSANDPLLTDVLDLRGKTSIRESATILSQARLFVGLEGFTMHLARSVECPAVIVFGGRTAPWQFGYSCNINLYSDVPCAPCWLWNKCDYDRKCMNQIGVAAVVDGVLRMLQRPRNPLVVDTERIQ